MIEIGGSTIDLATNRMIHRLIFNEPPTTIRGFESIYHDVRVVSQSGEYNADLCRISGLSQFAFSRVWNLYVAGPDFAVWLKRMEALRKGGSEIEGYGNIGFTFRNKPERLRGGRGNSPPLGWGNCLLGLSVRVDPNTSRLDFILTSRASYLGYMSVIDAAIPCVFAREAGLRDGQWRLIWDIQSARISQFRMMPYVWADDRLRNLLQGDLTSVESIPNKTWRSIVKMELKIRESFKKHGKKMAEPENERYVYTRKIKQRWLWEWKQDERYKPRSLGMTVSKLKLPKVKDTTDYSVVNENGDEDADY